MLTIDSAVSGGEKGAAFLIWVENLRALGLLMNESLVPGFV